MAFGFAQLLAYLADALLLSMLAFLAGRARLWTLGLLLLALTLSAPLGALYAVLKYDGSSTPPPGAWWCGIQLTLVAIAGGFAFLWKGGRLSPFILLYGLCGAVVGGCLLKSVVARSGLGDTGATCCAMFLGGCTLSLYLHFQSGVIPCMAFDQIGPASENSPIAERVRSLAKTLRIVVAWSAAWAVLAGAPWCFLIVKHDDFGFMAHPAGGPGFGALIKLLSVPALPAALWLGTLTSYVVSRKC